MADEPVVVNPDADSNTADAKSISPISMNGTAPSKLSVNHATVTIMKPPRVRTRRSSGVRVARNSAPVTMPHSAMTRKRYNWPSS